MTARLFRAQSTTSWRSKTSCPPDGTVRAAAGDVVDHVKTGQDGRATTKELYLGSGSVAYAFIETKPPSGHVIDETPVAFTLSYKDGATAEVKAASDQSDAAVKFEVDKTVMGADTPLPGAKFQAWNTDDEISIGSAARQPRRARRGRKRGLHQEGPYPPQTSNPRPMTEPPSSSNPPTAWKPSSGPMPSI